ncbi:hypothetical protein [Streptomyces antimycoticus]|uniref:hypothetical protein n=1 Tax=Streptomyces antimycoticus TaxID=68175 RepID=UPI0038634047|nr:hypothetical protein OG751_03900 [Streptomyces antimycoticus]
MSETSKVTPAEAQEIEATSHYVPAELCGKPVEIVPGGAWRQSAMRKLRNGYFDEFFEEVLSPESYELFLDLNPTNDEVGALLESVEQTSGESMGKSSGPSRSSRTTRRR